MECPVNSEPCKTCNNDKAEAVKWFKEVRGMGLNEASKEAARHFDAPARTWTQFRDSYRYRYGSVENSTVTKKTNNIFNLVNENIDWAKWSWNPVTGCLHGCEYCYARDIANRFYKNKFKPTFFKHRLMAPYNTTIPKELSRHPGRNKVFVCSMADLFGDWVDRDWIEKILQVCTNTPKWTYIFLTKNPKRYFEFNFPKNSWIGATGDNQNRFDEALTVFKDINSNIKFISAEPLTQNIRIKNEANIDWLIIGGQSKSTKTRAFQPPKKWVADLLYDAEKNGIKVYLKPNLKVVKEYPKAAKNE